LIIAWLLLISSAVIAQPTGDLVNLTNVPELNIYASNYSAAIYSGYLNVSSIQSFHYLFFESQNNPSTDPLLIWFNGGPGCSSLLGAFREHGPFVWSTGAPGFMWNDYSWNTNASVMYLESPGGVGYSIFTGHSSLTLYNDSFVGQLNLQALLLWYQKFPTFQSNELYVTGESYAGVYVPYLTYNVILYNQNPTLNFSINLAGMVVGNGYTWVPSDRSYGFPMFVNGHGFVPPTDWATFMDNNCLNNPNGAQVCGDLYAEFMNFYGAQINPFNVMSYCYNTTFNITSNWTFPGFLPACSDWQNLTNWLNTAGVQSALNVPQNITWFFCNSIPYTHNIDVYSLWAYPLIIEAGVRILFYSGDTDTIVSTVGSMNWIQQLNLQYGYTVLVPTTTFTVPGNQANETQTAGFWVQYQSLLFVQHKGVGHTVPDQARPAAWKMITYFLNNEYLN
jgi:serine carboxypeptidase-like clade 2